jgi:hypothetical protein
MAPPSGSLFYSVQGAILDHLTALGFPDRDGFAARLAGLYLGRRSTLDLPQLVDAASHLRTSSFAPRPRQRAEAMHFIVERLDKRFLADLRRWQTVMPASSAQRTKVRLLTQSARSRTTGSQHFDALLREYRKAIRANGVHEFWVSRRQGKLRSRLESLAQHSLYMFLYSPVMERNGFVLREVRSGTGFVDILAVFGRSRQYLVELKILRSGTASGLKQLAEYLGLQSLTEGWLVILDARKPRNRLHLQDETVVVDDRTVRRLVIDINPPAPSSLDRARR